MELAAVEHKLQVSMIRLKSSQKSQDTHFDFGILYILNCHVSALCW